MTREIKDLQPDYYDGVYEFDEIAKVEESKIADFDSYLIKQLNNLYASQSNEEGIRLFEEAYKIVPSSDEDLEARRRKIIARMLPPQAITLKFFESLCKSLNLDVRSEVDTLQAVYKAYVDADKFTDDNINELKGIIETYVPANLIKQIFMYQEYTSIMGSYIGIANRVSFYSHADFTKE